MQALSVALTDTDVSPGEAYLDNAPVLAAHTGAQPDLFLRWNRIPLSAQAIDVVVFLHGFSQSGGARATIGTSSNESFSAVGNMALPRQADGYFPATPPPCPLM